MRLHKQITGFSKFKFTIALAFFAVKDYVRIILTYRNPIIYTYNEFQILTNVAILIGEGPASRGWGLGEKVSLDWVLSPVFINRIAQNSNFS